tara:strand:+ start:1565 stop:3310 length:1746 start_codon:yes stop_codon:yes gene_type:complete
MAVFDPHTASTFGRTLISSAATLLLGWRVGNARRWPLLDDPRHIDLRTVALFRMSIGLCLLCFTANALPDACDFFARSELYIRRPDAPTCDVATALLHLQALAAVVLIVGYCSRYAAVACYLLFLWHLGISPATVTSDANLLLMGCLWSSLLPTGARWSLDAWLAKAPGVDAGARPTRVRSVAVLGAKAQLALLYASTVYFKLLDLHPSAGGSGSASASSPWLSGKAVEQALTCCEYQTVLGRWLLHPSLRRHGMLAALTSAVLLAEVLAPPLLLTLGGAWRAGAAALLAAMHLGIGLALEVRGYPAAVGAYLVLFSPGPGSATRPLREAPEPPLRDGPRTTVASVLIVALTVSAAIDSTLDRDPVAFYRRIGASAMAETAGGIGANPLSRWVAPVARAIGVVARADMFAPPPELCGWWVLPITLADGRTLDAHQLRHNRSGADGALSFAHPSEAGSWPARNGHSWQWISFYAALGTTSTSMVNGADTQLAATLLEGLSRYHCARVDGAVHIALVFVTEQYSDDVAGAAAHAHAVWVRNCSAGLETHGARPRGYRPVPLDEAARGMPLYDNDQSCSPGEIR